MSIRKFKTLLDSDYAAAVLLIGCVVVVVVFLIEAIIRSVGTGSALTALPWSVPAILAGALLFIIKR